jgi:hypothetical protein
MLESLWNLVAGLVGSAWGLLSAIVHFVGDVAIWLHVGAPRLEGLLVGVLLAWLLMRRDVHPVLRVLSAPLKLVLDILDLAWDQTVEVAVDLYGTAKGWSMGSLNWLVSKAKNSYTTVVTKLTSAKKKLKED